ARRRADQGPGAEARYRGRRRSGPGGRDHPDPPRRAEPAPRPAHCGDRGCPRCGTGCPPWRRGRPPRRRRPHSRAARRLAAAAQGGFGVSTAILLVVTGLGLGALYFLAASGLSLIYGLMGVLNFAH